MKDVAMSEEVARKIAERIVNQWDSHDSFRVCEAEKALWHSDAPNDVIVAKAFLRLLADKVTESGERLYEKTMGVTEQDLRQEISDLKALLGDVLKNDEYLEGFNEANLGQELRGRIREVISDMVPEPCKLPCDADSPCQECSGYWMRMRNEGLWQDGVGWTDTALYPR